MKRTIFCALALLASCAFLVPGAKADIPTTVFPVVIAGTGESTTYSIAGYLGCQLQFPVASGTATVAVEGASDTVPTFNTIVNAAAVASGGNIAFNIAQTGGVAYKFVRFNTTVYGGAPIAATLTCGPQLAVNAAGGGGGSTPIPYASDGSGNIKTNCQVNCTPNPNTPQTVQLAGTPLPVNANAAPTCSPIPGTLGGGQCGMLSGPASEPASRNANQAVIDNSGNQTFSKCAPNTTVCEQPTTAPPAAGAVPGTMGHTLANAGCIDQSGGAATSTSGNEYAVGCAVNSGHGRALATAACNGQAADSGAACAKVALPADGATASQGLETFTFPMLQNSNASTWDRARELPGTNGMASVGPGVTTKTNLSATVTTCTNVKSVVGVLVAIWYVSSAAQTGTLTVYDEATASCSGQIIYVSATHGVLLTPELLYMPYTNGVSYKWTTAAEVGTVFLGTNP